MIDKICSGVPTGADQAGSRAARASGVPTGGWTPRGFLTEDGPRPEFAKAFGAAETAEAEYRVRTERNVLDSEATVWFGSTDSAGAKVTLNACKGIGRPVMLVAPGRGVKRSDVAAWIARGRYKTLNVAGNRESGRPGIGDRVERFLGIVFRQLGHRGPPA